MSQVAWAAVGALAGFGLALGLIRAGLVPRRLTRGGWRGGGDGRGGSVGSEWTSGGPGDEAAVRVRLAYDDLKLIREDIQGMPLVRGDLKRIGELLGRLLEETMGLHRLLVPARPEPAGGSAGGGLREQVRDRAESTWADGAAWQRAGSDAGPLGTDEVRGRESRPGTPGDSRSSGASGWATSAGAQTPEPRPDAVLVEANNDAIVPSPRHPAEAWLERRGGEAEVWLNPAVPLTDPALQRWSTFFDWERREPGARFQTSRPALVTWSGGSGTLLRKGMARPV